MQERLTRFSIADSLTSAEAIAAFLAEAAACNNARYLAHARAIAVQAHEALSRRA